jgi:glycosyltransferase involved in cell wall biosynthesis
MIAAEKSGDPANMLISCLMVTTAAPRRLPYAEAAMTALRRQTHRRHELILVLPSGMEDARRRLVGHAAAIGLQDVRVLDAAPELSLGAGRNLGFANAAGEVICQWDDDDFYHPDRLKRQLALLIEGGHAAVYLRDVMQYFPVSQQLFWTNWQATEDGGHAGTLMVRRATPVRYPEDGANSRLGEDSQVARWLRARGMAGYLASQAHLFVYVSHGFNAWDDGHHRLLADRLAISRGLLLRREAELRAGLQPFGFVPGTIAVTGGNGIAFLL